MFQPRSSSCAKCFNSRSGQSISVKDILKYKQKFLKKAKYITQQRLSRQLVQLTLSTDIPEVQEDRAQFYLPVGNSDGEMGSTSQQLDMNEGTGKTSVMTSTYDREISQYTGVKTRANHSNTCTLRETVGNSEDAREQRGECVRREIESDCGKSKVKHDIGHPLKGIENDYRKIIQTQNREKPDDVEILIPDGLGPGSQMILVPGRDMALIKQENYSKHVGGSDSIGPDSKTEMCLEHSYERNRAEAKELPKEEKNQMTDCHNSQTTIKSFNKHIEVKTVIPKKMSFYLENNEWSCCDTETSGCEGGHNRSQVTQADKTAATEIEHVTCRHGEDTRCTKCWTQHYKQCPYLQKLSQHRFHDRQPRIHTVSESALALLDIPLMNMREHLPLNRTFPNFEVARNSEPNADLETSGMCIILNVNSLTDHHSSDGAQTHNTLVTRCTPYPLHLVKPW